MGDYAKPIPVTAAIAAERSGSLTITDVDPAAWELFTTEPRVRRAAVRLQSFDPEPCPSPWRHPVAWLRWNPLVSRRITMVLPNCEIASGEDGSVTLTPRPAEPAPDLLNFQD
ncbi:MAG TPA: hypothetical protein VFS48_00535 [Solirubrobacterales bacterium]|nr:hypothetical protein [Solirubrobacterales bacterium]